MWLRLMFNILDIAGSELYELSSFSMSFYIPQGKID